MKNLKNTNVYSVNVRTVAFTGFALMISGFVFAIIETAYFGSSYLPESKSELACDFISALLSGAGGGLVMLALIIKARAQYKELQQELVEIEITISKSKMVRVLNPEPDVTVGKCYKLLRVVQDTWYLILDDYNEPHDMLISDCELVDAL